MCSGTGCTIRIVRYCHFEFDQADENVCNFMPVGIFITTSFNSCSTLQPVRASTSVTISLLRLFFAHIVERIASICFVNVRLLYSLRCDKFSVNAQMHGPATESANRIHSLIHARNGISSCQRHPTLSVVWIVLLFAGCWWGFRRIVACIEMDKWWYSCAASTHPTNISGNNLLSKRKRKQLTISTLKASEMRVNRKQKRMKKEKA